MPRMIFGVIGMMIAVGFGWWRYSMMSDLNDQMSTLSFEAVGMPGGPPPGDLQTLSTPAGALNYLNHVAETLAQADDEYQRALEEQAAISGSQGVGSAGSAQTASARGGRILSIVPEPAATPSPGDCDLDGGACADASTPAAPAQVRVIRPSR